MGHVYNMIYIVAINFIPLNIRQFIHKYYLNKICMYFCEPGSYSL